MKPKTTLLLLCLLCGCEMRVKFKDAPAPSTNGLIVMTNMRPASNYTVAMYSNDIRAMTSGTLTERISNLACTMFDKGFDAGFQCARSGGNETNAAFIKAWHRDLIRSLDKLAQ